MGTESGEEKTDEKTEMHKVVSLWTGRGKVAFSGFVEEDLTIPKGAKILAFNNSKATPQNRQPTIRLVWIPPQPQK
tara:strand:+ start:2435 stop:2662 length:228 start_codon:yes stop_codon:yes gene_type:complete